jgi:phospholipid/cholesterol/gamma-HCH transport system substrate-binding protein
VKRLIAPIVIAAVATVTAFGAQQLRAEDGAFILTADVTQAPNLFEGGRVMIRGVEVGKIVAVAPRPDGVRLSMEIDEDVVVPANATLSVVPITVISDRYVQLFPAYTSGDRMEDGDHIPVERTSIPAELDEVLTQLEGLLSALEPKGGEKTGPLARLITELDSALAGRAEHLAGTLTGSADVLENLADSESELVQLIKNLDTVFIALADRSSEIGILNERFRLVAESLLADQDNLEGTIENLAYLSEQTAGLIDESGDDLGSSFERLERVLTTILEHEKELNAGIKWSNVIAEALGETDGSGRGTHAYTGRQTAQGATGAEYNYRIDTRDTIACERIEVLVEGTRRVNPAATYEALRDTVLDFIPTVYQDDLLYLVELLLGPCANAFPPGTTSVQEKRMDALVDVLMAQVGSEELDRLVTSWLPKTRKKR